MRSAAGWTLTASGLALIAAVMSHRTLYQIPYIVWAIFFGAALVLVLNASPSSLLGRVGQSRLLRFFGKYSYGMYVYQNLLIPLAEPVWSASGLIAWTGSDAGGRLAYLTGMLPLTVLTAWCSWHLYEARFLKLKRYFGGQV